MAKEGKYALLRLPSGERRKVLLACRATVGAVSNPSAARVRIGKAGRNRWLGRRPKVRGAVSYTHLRAHETVLDLVCRLPLEKTKTHIYQPVPPLAIYLDPTRNSPVFTLPLLHKSTPQRL